ncbi:MAG: efflux RND transporter periplasmic adaptor subunit [Verrucomicrobiota bacterium]|nr:efflux RND transporter periplasmic adaptor subunit [Verrucomicrobiota bacterium]
MKILFPFLVFGILLFGSWKLIQMRPEPQAREVKRKIPFVEAIQAEKKPLRSSILAYGTIQPRTQTTLIAEVPGIIEEVAPFESEGPTTTDFRPGGFFQKGDLLLKIEDVDLVTMEAEARANLRRVELQLIQERELAKQAKIEWGDRDWSLASDLVKRIPQIEKAEAETRAAEARLTQATRDLNRSQVRAPFEGRILKTMADVGQQVGSGASAALAEIYALDSAEINLALSRSEMGFLGFADGFKPSDELIVQTQVLDVSGKVIHEGLLDRSEGVVDPRTRLTNLIAKVDDCFANPYSKKPVSNPLAVGQFVSLRLVGAEVNVFLVPESAFRTQETVLVVDNENRLHTREVSVIHRTDKEAWVTSGLTDGEKVCITPIEIISEGMQVKMVNPVEDTNETQP